MSEYETLILRAMYVPLLYFCGIAAWKWGYLLVGILRKRQFDGVRHEPLIALVLFMVAFFVENVYYGTARSDPELFDMMAMFFPAIISFKTLIILAAMLALDSYYRAVDGKSDIRRRLFAGFGMWAATVFVLWLGR